MTSGNKSKAVKAPMKAEEELQEPPEPPMNWGSPFMPTTPRRAMQEAALLLKLGIELKNHDALAMPEFVNRLLWIRDWAENGESMSRREGAAVEAAWHELKTRTARYMATMLNDEWRYILNDEYGWYDPQRVSDSISQFTGVTDKEDGAVYLNPEPLTTLVDYCREVAVKNPGGSSYGWNEFIGEVYAGEHVVSGDGNRYWRDCWCMDPDKWERFHKAFQEGCADIKEPMEASQARKGKGKGKGNHAGIKGKGYTKQENEVMREVFNNQDFPTKEPADGKWPPFDYDKAEAYLIDASDQEHPNKYNATVARLEKGGKEVRGGLEAYLRAYKRKHKRRRRQP